MKSKIIEWWEELIEINNSGERTAAGATFAFVGGLVAAVALTIFHGTTGRDPNFWFLGSGFAVFLTPYLLGLAELIARGANALLSPIVTWPFKATRQLFQSSKAKAAEKRSEAQLVKFWSEGFDADKIEPLVTNDQKFSPKLLREASEEFFRDQLGRAFHEDESVTVIQTETLGETEALVLTSFKRSRKTENGHGATKDEFHCVSVGLRFKLFPENNVLMTELLQTFPALQHRKMMWSIVSDTAESRRRADNVLNSVYEKPAPSPYTPLPKQPERVIAEAAERARGAAAQVAS